MATCTVPKNRQLKLECAGCGMIARASRTAMLRHGLPTHCGRPMHPDDVEIAREILPVEEWHWHDDLQAAQERDVRSAAREPRAAKLGVARPQCHGCRTFLKAHNAHCTRCGFDNAAGAYREGSSRHDDIPF